MFNFDKVVSREQTDCYKWDGREIRFGKADLIPLSVADADLPACPEMIQALVKRAAHPFYGYTMVPQRYFELFSSWLERRFAWQVEPASISVVPGVVTALSVCIHAFTKPGEQVIITPPVYPPFFSVIKAHQCEPLYSQLRLVDSQYVIDFEDLAFKMKSGARLMILCSPHNPVGRVWSQEELRKLCDLCSRNDVLLISDEIHADLIYPGQRHFISASISEECASRTITCMAPSKTFNIAGLKVSNVVITNPDLRKQFVTTCEKFDLLTISPFGLTAAEAAYANGENWLKAFMEYIAANCDFLNSFLKSECPAIKLIRPQGTYLAWLDFRELGISDPELVRLLIEKARVGLDEGLRFGPGGSGFYRINIACARVVLEEALNRIKTALNRHVGQA